MKRFLVIGLAFMTNPAGLAQQPVSGSYPVYDGTDLGLVYNKKASFFRIWAPSATKARLMIYDSAGSIFFSEIYTMKKDRKGTWTYRLKGDHRNRFYNFSVFINQQWSQSVPDPYAKAVGVNGHKAMIVDLQETNPPGWKKDKSPAFKHKTDAVIYELHVRDASIHPFSGMIEKGKFRALAETGTQNPGGNTTGLDHLAELGVTHIQLLPVFDFFSLNETLHHTGYNWGYDPLNYNVPEGTYASNPSDGISRIREFKEMVQAMHKKGLRVIMDVVYNHTALTETSFFEQLVPGYYYRKNTDGNFSNASSCGNETASERPMMQKFILESLKYWVQEYHIDGFRFDLMGIHDIRSMNLISAELHRLKPSILLLGEGWTAGVSPLNDSLRALKANVSKLDRIAVFNDDTRDGIKGSVFDYADRGFASGKPGMVESVKFGITAAVWHPQVNYLQVNYSKNPYAVYPHQTIIYADCHDNHVLADKIDISCPNANNNEKEEMNRLALSVVLTSQGIPFLHAGSEFLRSKKNVENSFQSPDSINAIDWSLKTKHRLFYEYIRTMVHMRRAHPAFRMKDPALIARNIRFLPATATGVIAYTIDAAKLGDSWKKILVCLNGTSSLQNINAGSAHWTVFIKDNRPTAEQASRGLFTLKPYSCSIYYIR